MSVVRLYRARAEARTLAWTVDAWHWLGLGPGSALFSTAEGLVIAQFDAGPPLVEIAFDVRIMSEQTELRWLAAGRREGLRVGTAVLVAEIDMPLVEGFVRLEPHDAHPREVGHTVPAALHGAGHAGGLGPTVSVALRLVEYVDDADPDHPGRVDERLASTVILPVS